MELLALRTAIEEKLEELLGEYKLSNGSTTPAISVRSTGERIPPGTKVSGLEAVIIREPDLQEARVYKDALALRRWTVYLVDWSGQGDLEAAASELVYAFGGARTFPVLVPEGAGPKAQRRVVIPTSPPAT